MPLAVTVVVVLAGIAGVMVFWVQMPGEPGAVAVTAARSGGRSRSRTTAG